MIWTLCANAGYSDVWVKVLLFLKKVVGHVIDLSAFVSQPIRQCPHGMQYGAWLALCLSGTGGPVLPRGLVYHTECLLRTAAGVLTRRRLII